MARIFLKAQFTNAISWITISTPKTLFSSNHEVLILVTLAI